MASSSPPVASEWEDAAWYSKWSFSCANAMINKGCADKNIRLQLDDLMKLPHHDQASTLVSKYKETYEASRQFLFIPRLVMAMWRMHFDECNVIVFYTILEDVIRVASPVILRLFLIDLQNPLVNASRVFMWAAILSALNIAQTLVHHILFFYSMRLGNNMKVSTIGIIFDKVLSLKSFAMSKANVDTGRLVNLISNDVFRFEEAAIFVMVIIKTISYMVCFFISYLCFHL